MQTHSRIDEHTYKNKTRVKTVFLFTLETELFYAGFWKARGCLEGTPEVFVYREYVIELRSFS